MYPGKMYIYAADLFSACILNEYCVYLTVLIDRGKMYIYAPDILLHDNCMIISDRSMKKKNSMNIAR